MGIFFLSSLIIWVNFICAWKPSPQRFKGRHDRAGHLHLWFCPSLPHASCSRSGLVLVTARHSHPIPGDFQEGAKAHMATQCLSSAFPVGNWIRLRTQRWKVNHPPGFLGHPGRVSVWKRSSTLWREILTGDEKTLPAHSPCCASICSHSWEGVIYIQSPAFCLGDAGLLKLTVGASEMCDLSWPPTWGLCPLAARQPPGEDNPEAI